MKKLKNEDIINMYINSGEISYEATLNGDYKKNNKEYTKLVKIYKYFEKNIDMAKQTLPVLFRHQKIEVKSIAATHCLALGIYVKEAEKILQEIANDEKSLILSFEAKMTLKVWREGNLTIYKKK